MVLRTRLILYFFNISILIIIVGMVFYMQLKNLVGPLTPESIPQGVEQLANVIDKNDMVNRLKYQQLLVEFNLDNYLYTNNRLSLQAYYMNNAIVSQLLEKMKAIDPAKFSVITGQYDTISQVQAGIIKLVQSNAVPIAKQEINSNQYLSLVDNYKKALSRYFQRPDMNSNEAAVVSVKLAVKNSHNVLQQSLHSTLIILFDAIIASIVLVLLSTRAIVQPINMLRNNIEQMGADKLTITINAKLLLLKGEVGDLARSFAELFYKLRAATVLRDELLIEIQRHKETEQELQQTAARLRESNLDLDQFAYAASHDLRAPLRAIESLTQWIVEDCYDLLPEEARKNLDLIKKRVRRLDALVTGMLDYSRIGRITQEKERLDLNKLLSETIEDLTVPPHIKIAIDTVLPVITADKAQITQVFLNLISNAIKYNDKAQGRINIGHQRIVNYYQFYVVDNGCGIDPQFQEKAFEIFQTLQPRDVIEGSGIGLAIVKKIIEKNGGKIWLNSVPHQGSKFSFTWPIEMD